MGRGQVGGRGGGGVKCLGRVAVGFCYVLGLVSACWGLAAVTGETAIRAQDRRQETARPVRKLDVPWVEPCTIPVLKALTSQPCQAASSLEAQYIKLQRKAGGGGGILQPGLGEGSGGLGFLSPYGFEGVAEGAAAPGK